MRTLRLEKYGKVVLDGEDFDINSTTDKSEFISGLLLLDVEIADDVSIGDLIHFFYESKDLIFNLFSTDYEVVRALATSSSMQRPHKHARIFKSFKIEHEIEEDQEFMYMIPELEIVPAEPGEDGLNNISSLLIQLDENIKFVHNDVTIESRTKFTLLDLMSCLFEELPAIIQEGIILLP